MCVPFAYLLTRHHAAAVEQRGHVAGHRCDVFLAQRCRQPARTRISRRMKAALPESAWRFLSATGGSWDAPLSGPPLALAGSTACRRTRPARASMRPCCAAPMPPSDDVPGSNSFAVSGALTGGPGMVANDMHLELRVPDIWFRARLIFPNPRRRGETIDVSGASLPGTPAIVAGSNRSIAWGFTNSYARPDRLGARACRSGRREVATGPPKAASRSAPTSNRSPSRATPPKRWKSAKRAGARSWPKDADGTPLALAWTAHREGAVNLELHATRNRRDRGRRRSRSPSTPACRRRTSSSPTASAASPGPLPDAFRSAWADSIRSCPRTGAARDRLEGLARACRDTADLESAGASGYGRPTHAWSTRHASRLCSATAATISALARVRSATTCARAITSQRRHARHPAR